MYLPSTFVADFHEDTPQVNYFKLGHTDMVVSNFAMGGASFGMNENIFNLIMFQINDVQYNI